MWLQSWGQEDLLEEELYPRIVAWRIPWTEGPGGLQSIGSERVGLNRRDLPRTHIHKIDS